MSNYSRITLFRNTKFYSNQNYKIDNIEEFLNTYLSADKKIFNKQQYWKINGINKEFKLDIIQSEIKNIHEYNYAKVEMIIENEYGAETVEWTLYYFIHNFSWLSRSTIKLSMEIDTLNTFLDGLEFHPKTFIEREHIDRWNYHSYIKNTDTHKITLLRNIPEINEGLNPQKYAYCLKDDSFSLISKENERMKIDASRTSQPFIAIYLGDSTHQDQSPLYFIPALFGANPFYIDYGAGATEATKITNLNRDAQDNQRIIVLPYPPHEELFDLTQYSQNNPFSATSDNLLKASNYVYNTSSEIPDLKGIYYEGEQKLNPDKKEIIISGWISNSEQFGKFDSYISSLFISKPINYETLISEIVDNGYFRKHAYSNESAMYNSEFLDISFDYMDNTFSLGLEDFKYNGNKTLEQLLDFENYPNGFISIKYSFSVFMDNSIYFKFSSEQNSFEINLKSPTDYIMIVPLLSQLPIMNNEWLNYQRNGYNFDIKIRDTKRKEISEMNNLAKMTDFTHFITANPFSFARNIFTTGIHDVQRSQEELYRQAIEDLEMEKSIAQMKGSKLGIEQISGGLDKVNQVSAGYRLGITFKLPRRSWFKYLEDYFYYFGSKSQYYGIPTHNNRCLFDYLKCKAEFVNRNSLPTQEALSDIINRLNAGVMFIHKFMNQWTFDSDYKENIERELYNIISEEN